MRKVLKLLGFAFFALFSVGFTSNSTKSYNLFYIGRSKDENIIKYDINLTSEGKINTEKPLKIYWVKYTDNNRIEKLSYIQNTLAYGVKYLSTKSDQVKFQFVSYDKRTFIIKKNNQGSFRVITALNDNNVEIKRIYIQIDGGTFMLPKISYVQMFWRDSSKNKEDIEIIKP